MKNQSATKQLTLLSTSPVNTRFQLSRDTRERGMRHVAEIRKMLAERHTNLDADGVHVIHPSSKQAA